MKREEGRGKKEKAPLMSSVKMQMKTSEHLVTMHDGVRLYTFVMTPAETGAFPTVILRNPYVGEEPPDVAKVAEDYRAITSRGYALVLQHCRGCGQSEGDWIPSENERADGLTLLDWVRAQSWYNGEIYLAGSSYLATVHFSYLDTDPPDVKAAALFVQDNNHYRIALRNGFFKVGLLGGWFQKCYRKKNHELQRDESVSFFDFPLCDFARRYWGEEVPAFTNVVSHPRADDPYWQSHEAGASGDYNQALAKSTMPIFFRTALYDIYTEGVCDMWRDLPAARRATCALAIDAYDHGGHPQDWMAGTRAVFPGGERPNWLATALDWFDHIRLGRPCPDMTPGRTRYYAIWENAWHEAEELADGPRAVTLPLGAGTRGWTYDPTRPPPDFPGSGGICFGSLKLQPPPDFRDDVVSFLLTPVEAPLDVRGRMTAQLSVTSDCDDTCFYVRVSVRKDDGNWYLLRDDIASLCGDGASYAPGSTKTLSFRFADHAFRLEKGDVLRVDVASASPHFAPHPNLAGDTFAATTPRIAYNAVDASASTLTLPVLE